VIGAVADTHALIWYLLDSPRLSKAASVQFDTCRRAGSNVGISSVSVIEIIYLIEKGRIPAPTLTLLEDSLSERFTLLEVIPVTYDIALDIRKVPRQQVPDLPDRIIAATALFLNVPLITRDRKICSSDIETVW
jgi:PIN domain nuclease of toxin-antitoxin system